VVNDKHNGFLTEADRAGCYGELGARFCLTAQQWDVLLHLDAEENQLLTRLGTVPKPVNIVALYNFHSLETTLRRATQILLAGLVLTPTDAADIRALGRALGVKAVVSGDKVTLTFPEATEANTLLPRRTVGLSRCLLHLVEAYATRATLGSVETVLAGRKFRFLLSTDALKVLGMPIKPSEEKPHFKRRFEAAQTLHKELLKLRAKGEGRSWKLKRLPEPIVAAGSVTLPDFTLTRGGTVLPIWTHKKLAAADVLARAEASAQDLFAVPEQAMPAVPGDVRALCDRAAAEGMVRTAEARRILHLLDESPLIEWIRQAADPRVRYIPGVGLCSSDMITAIHGEPPINTVRNA